MAPSATTLATESETNKNLGALGTTVSGKKLKIRSYPIFKSLEEERIYRKQHLAAAFRVLVPLLLSSKPTSNNPQLRRQRF